MPKSTGGHPTHDFALVPDGLIADCVRVRGIDFERHQAQRSAALLLFGAAVRPMKSPFFRSTNRPRPASNGP